jgi:chemotaxis signal transduction protein
VSLYLRIAVGAGHYLLDAGQIAEIRPYTGGAVEGDDVPIIDLRTLFAAAAEPGGCAILATLASGAIIALIADRADNLIEIADAEWQKVPPIGPVGDFIDAICLLPDADKPLLRLRMSSEATMAAAQIA